MRLPPSCPVGQVGAILRGSFFGAIARVSDDYELGWVMVVALVMAGAFWTEARISIALGIVGVLVTVSLAVWGINYRAILREDISVILRRCRESQTWDDRSELKLGQWLLDTPEDQLHKCRLLKLRRIRNSLADYLYIHVYGRDPVPAAGWLERTLQKCADRLRYRRESRVRQQKNAKGRKRRRAAR